MITEQDLHEAIAECQGTRSPNANTCIKLAAYYTILDNMFPKESPGGTVESYSYDQPPSYTSKTEFGQAVYYKDQNDVMQIMDELMMTIQMLQPKLYAAVMRKITAL